MKYKDKAIMLIAFGIFILIGYSCGCIAEMEHIMFCGGIVVGMLLQIIWVQIMYWSKKCEN